jgi:DNA-binding IclR family transcriptional regulator
MPKATMAQPELTPSSLNAGSPKSTKSHAPWTFLTNHAHVLLCLSQPGDGLSLREVAAMVGITERAVQRIVQELEAGGVILRERQGRRNTYRVNRNAKLRHPVEAHCNVGQLLDLVMEAQGG